MFIIGPIWLVFILFLLSTPTGARVANALVCALIGVLVLVGIGTAMATPAGRRLEEWFIRLPGVGQSRR